MKIRLLLSMLGLALLAACAPSGPSPVATPAPVVTAPKASSAPVRKVPVEWRSRLPEVKPADIEKTLSSADAALANEQLERGNTPGPGALELYLAVIQFEPDNEQAQQGVRASMEALFERGRIAMRSGDIALAEHIESIARSVQPDHRDLPDYRNYLAQARAARLAELQMRQQLAKAWARARAEDFKAADQWLLTAEKSAPDSVAPKVLGLRIIELRQARTDALLAQGNAAVARMQLDRADRLLAHVANVAGSMLAALSLHLPAQGLSKIMECRLRTLTTKGKITVKDKLIGRRSVEESAFLEDVADFVSRSGAAGNEEMLSCARPDGTRLALRSRAVRDELKRTCESEGLPPTYFSSNSLRKGAITITWIDCSKFIHMF